jgi:glycosyltransferase involved in cell wall biosynthesis
MIKVFILPAREDWVCDRLCDEFKRFCDKGVYNIVSNPVEADVIWLLASWCWNQIPFNILKGKKVITTVHHIVPEKFGYSKKSDFVSRDFITDVYHVPSDRTAQQIQGLTNKKVLSLPWWINNNIFFPMKCKNSLLNKHGIDVNGGDIVIGSFQRDTEGIDLRSPKMEKGPDIFVDVLNKIKYEYEISNIHVLLSGWRRNYVIDKLKLYNINYTYIERPSINVINELYNCLDWYFVTSRYEGGPQAIPECVATKTNVLSTDVGVTNSFLPKKYICSIDNNVVDSFCNMFLNNINSYDKVDNFFKSKEYFVGKYLSKFDFLFNF